MNKSESKYFNTAQKMDRAFLELIGKKDFEYITVKEICQSAGVNRSTFYLHYETVNDLLSESIRYMIDGFIAEMRGTNDSFASILHTCSLEELYLISPKYLVPYLEYIFNNKKIFCIAVDNPVLFGLERVYSRMFDSIFTPILDRFGVDKKSREYMVSFYISGLMAIIKKWLKSDCREPIDYIIEIMQRCIPQINQL